MLVDFPQTETTMVWFFMIDCLQEKCPSVANIYNHNYIIIKTGLTYSLSIKKEMACYVCIPSFTLDGTEYLEINNIFSSDDIKNIPICGTNAANNFTLKCPDGYKGCLTKTHGKNVLKSCYEYNIGITDCKIANNVKYCFCADSFCNDATILTPIPTLTDDEDLDQSTEDGSGLFDHLIELNKYEDPKQNTIVIMNNTMLKNKSLTTSTAKLFMPKNINILSLLFIIYKTV